MTQESVTCRKTEAELLKCDKLTVHLKNFATADMKYPPLCEVSDTASTLLARDYKGPANFVKMNGVIECQK